MKAQINREVLNRLLSEMGVPEERINSLKIVIRREPERAGFLERLRTLTEKILPRYIRLGEYNYLRNVLTIYFYPWQSRAGVIHTIAHESAHIKQGWKRPVLPVTIQLLAILLGAMPVPAYFFIWRHINNVAWQLVSLLPYFGWLALVEQVTQYLRTRLPHEREADSFANEAVSNPHWQKVIKIKRD